MSLVTLLSLQDDQIDVVTESVRVWCEEHNHDINSEQGRAALQAAITVALADQWDPKAFQSKLKSRLTGHRDF
jgi:hypothetical protein